MEFIVVVKNKKRLNYIAEIFLPAKSAYSIHVMKMCNSFSSIGYKINLFILNKKKNSNIFNYYNCKNKFKIVNTDIGYNNFCTRIIFAIKILIRSRHENNSFYISRSVITGLLLNLFKKNVIIEIHHELKSLSNFLFNIIKRTRYFNYLKFIFISKNLANLFYINKKNYIILDDAVSLEDFKNTYNKKWKYNKTCVYAGSFTKGKGVENIIQIAKFAKKIQFHLYGDISISEYSANDFKENVHYMGYAKYKDIPKILSQYKVLLMPYSNKVYVRSNNLEISKVMSPLKLFEYMASKRVIIAKYLPIYKHILNKKNSILIKSNLPKLWAREINFAFKNFKITKNLGFEAYRDVKKYTWNLRAEKIVKFLNV